MLVVILMALASVMAYALLAGQTLQAVAASYPATQVQADALAESGLELAMYYLQHPKNAPSLTPMSGTVPAYWTGNSSITFSGLSGSANVAVTPDGTSGTLFNVTSIGSAAAPGGGTLTKTVSAIVQVSYTFQAPQAMASDAIVNLNSKMTISGNPTAIVTPSSVNVTGTEHITGTIYASSVTGDSGATVKTPPTSGIVPTYSLVTGYSSYTYQSHSENATTIATTGNQNPATGNLAGVFQKTNGTVTLVGPMTINGTIYVKNGDLDISGAVIVNPTAGFPAVVVNGALNFTGVLSNSLTATGLVYLQNGVNTSNVLSATSLNITGALMTNTATVTSNYDGNMSVLYNANDVAVTNFTSDPAYMTPTNVKIVSYSP
jgi:hypothetical protein